MAIENQTLDELLGLAATTQSENSHTPTTVNNYANLDSSVTNANGVYDSNENKIWNSLTPAELQMKLGDVVGNQAVLRNEDGSKYTYANGQKVPYTGDTRRLYAYGTKDDPDNVKVGLSTGRYDTSDVRYTPGVGWPSGDSGVDLNKKILDVELPYNVATEMEALVHGNKTAQQARLVQLADTKKRKLFGSGASEYYDSIEGVLGNVASEDITKLAVPAVTLNAAEAMKLNPKQPTRGVDAVMGYDAEGKSLTKSYVLPNPDRSDKGAINELVSFPGALAASVVKGTMGAADFVTDLGQ